jgi:hypothetical protein
MAGGAQGAVGSNFSQGGQQKSQQWQGMRQPSMPSGGVGFNPNPQFTSMPSPNPGGMAISQPAFAPQLPDQYQQPQGQGPQMPSQISQPMPSQISQPMPQPMPSQISQPMPSQISQPMPSQISQPMPSQISQPMPQPMPQGQEQQMPFRMDQMPPQISQLFSSAKPMLQDPRMQQNPGMTPRLFDMLQRRGMGQFAQGNPNAMAVQRRSRPR